MSLLLDLVLAEFFVKKPAMNTWTLHSVALVPLRMAKSTPAKEGSLWSLRVWGLRFEISGQAEFFPGPCFFQPREVVFLRPVVRIAAEQQSQWRFLFLRQSHDRLSRLFRITGLLTVVVALKPGGCSNSRVVVGISFAQFGGTAGEVGAKATRLNDGDLDA